MRLEVEAFEIYKKKIEKAGGDLDWAKRIDKKSGEVLCPSCIENFLIDKKGKEKPMKKIPEAWYTEGGLPEAGMWKTRFYGDGYFTKNGKLMHEIFKATGCEREPDENYLQDAAMRAVAWSLRESDRQLLRDTMRRLRRSAASGVPGMLPVRYEGMSATLAKAYKIEYPEETEEDESEGKGKLKAPSAEFPTPKVQLAPF